MRLPTPLLALLLLLPAALSTPSPDPDAHAHPLARAPKTKARPQPRAYDTHAYYVLHHAPSDPDPASATASASLHECIHALGVELVEQVGELRDHWLVRLERPQPRDGAVGARSTSSGGQVQRDEVMERYRALRRRAKPRAHGLARARDGEMEMGMQMEARRVVGAIRSLQPQVARQRTKRGDPPPPRQAPVPLLRPQTNVTTADDVAAYLDIHDPEFTAQWHLVNSQSPFKTINVTGVWDMGITGAGVRVAVIDDGLDMDSDDLAANYDADGSWDFNDHVPEPKPRLSDDRHGTRCTGEIGAVRNDVCGVGVAYDTRLSGVRILSGPISDADEAASLNYGYEGTSIYSCSWGPPDDGMSMEAPQDLIQKAMLNGVQNGRGGLGSIFVFASGNGAGAGDQCNFDGYTNSIFSITVAAIDKNGLHPYYSEACAANLVVAYSSGGGDNIHTTDVGKNKCTSSHGGTSAAAPLVAGVMALALQARPELTWRDAQHLVVRSSVHINPDDPDWEQTASGRPYSYKYGYGAIDGYTLVELAKTWPLVKPQAWVDVGEVDLPGAEMDWEGHMSGGTPIGPGGVSTTLGVTAAMLAQANFESMEHVTVRVWISHMKRGDVEVQLESPNGIVSMLAGRRPRDEDPNGFKGWQFSSVKHWEENPIGDWKLTVHDQQSDNNGSFLGWSMMLWGSVVDPAKARLWQMPSSVPDEGGEGDDDDAGDGGATSTLDAGASQTKQLSKPTDHLPGNHTDETGEAHLPAFTPKPPGSGDATATGGGVADVEDPAASASASASPMPAPLDEGYFDHIRDLLKSSSWLIGTVVLVALFLTGAGIYYWRRRYRRRRAAYKGLTGDDVAMGSLESGRGRGRGNGHGSGSGNGSGNGAARTKEIYDPFAVTASDEESDEDDADETAALTSGRAVPPVGYHDGFLEDEDPASAAPPRPLYRDEPDAADKAREGAGAGSGQAHEDGEDAPPRSSTKEAGSGDEPPLV